MAISKSGGGYQVGDGNASEVTMYMRGPATTMTAAKTLTIGELASGLVSATSSGSYAMTTPTALELDAGLVNAQIGHAFNLALTHGSATNVITMTGGTGVTVVGLATVTGVTSGTWQFRKTGVAAWSVYRI